MKRLKIMLLLLLVPTLLFTGCGKEENIDNEDETTNNEVNEKNEGGNISSGVLEGDNNITFIE